VRVEDASLLAAYDLDARWNARIPGMRREESARTVRHVPALPGDGVVLASRLDAGSADAAIRAECARFAEAGRPFEWKLFAHDQPADLRARLETAGFDIGAEERLCVLDLGAAGPAVPRGPRVVAVSDDAGLRVVEGIWSEVWPGRDPSLVAQLREEMRLAPDALGVYLALFDGEPAAAGWLSLPPASRFAGIWGGATRPAFRGRGCYRALVAARVAAARARGFRWLTVDAGPMSAPILARLGFRQVGTTWPCRAPGPHAGTGTEEER